MQIDPEKRFDVNISMKKLSLCLTWHWNYDKSDLLVNGKEMVVKQNELISGCFSTWNSKNYAETVRSNQRFYGSSVSDKDFSTNK